MIEIWCVLPTSEYSHIVRIISKESSWNIWHVETSQWVVWTQIGDMKLLTLSTNEKCSKLGFRVSFYIVSNELPETNLEFTSASKCYILGFYIFKFLRLDFGLVQMTYLSDANIEFPKTPTAFDTIINLNSLRICFLITNILR